MTAEERLAYFQGEKHRSKVSQIEKNGKNTSVLLLKIKFFVAVVIFVLFLSLDYTGYEFHGIGSEEVISYVITDIDLSNFKGKFTL